MAITSSSYTAEMIGLMVAIAVLTVAGLVVAAWYIVARTQYERRAKREAEASAAVGYAISAGGSRP